MKKPDFFIGVDTSSDTFAVSVGTAEPWRILSTSPVYENTTSGFEDFLKWLGQNGYTPDRSIICMEATGVYGQALAYFLVAHNYRVAVEPPLKVKRAFPTHGHKNDITDSQHLGEYAYRFFDELHLWQPPDNVLKQVRTLIKTREQLTKNLSSYQSTLKILRREVVRTPLAERMYEDLMKELRSLIKEIDKQIQSLMEQHPFFKHKFELLLSVPGVGLQLASYILVITGNREPRANDIAAYVGICPYQHTSGTSVRRRPRSRKNGPGSIRKLLYLSALSLRTHQDHFNRYFMRKVAQGKPKKLVINNISNKLLRIMCAVMKSGKPYIPGYVSIRPEFPKVTKCA